MSLRRKPQLKDDLDLGMSNESKRCMATPKGAVHLSLCAGYGGIDMGLEMAGIDIGYTVYVEIEAYAVANLVKKIQAGVLGQGSVYSDVKTFPFKKFRGCIDILSGGFPCTPFSTEGLRKAEEDPRHLFPYFKQGIEDCMPSIILLENVDGIATATLGNDTGKFKKGTPVLQYVCGELEQLGYVVSPVVTTASETGANISRKRWFITAILRPTSQRLYRTTGRVKCVDSQSIYKRIFRTTNRTFHSSSLWKQLFPTKKSVRQNSREPKAVIRKDEVLRFKKEDMCRTTSNKSKIRRTRDGDSSRAYNGRLQRSVCSPVDEMRLLGNGVCPHQAANGFVLGMKQCLDKLRRYNEG